MKTFTRQYVVRAIAGFAAIAVLATAGCGRLDRSGQLEPAGDAAAETTDLAWPAQALQSIGLDPVDLAPAADEIVATPAGDSASPATARPDRDLRRKHRLLRYAFGRDALHGEAVVATDEGTKTVVAQRGTVTAIDATSVTVKSTDGFTLTWIFGTPITVLERRGQVQPSAIAVGTAVGVAGEKTGTTTSARLIVVPRKAA